MPEDRSSDFFRAEGKILMLKNKQPLALFYHPDNYLTDNEPDKSKCSFSSPGQGI
jgi:hypothetical protein